MPRELLAMSHHLERGHLLYQQDRYKQAADEFRAALADDPTDAEAHAFLAQCLLELKDNEGALHEANEAVRLAPLHFLPFTVLATVLHRLERHADAEAAALEAISHDPYVAWPFAVLANIRFSRNNWAGALEATTRGLELDPNNAACLSLNTLANLRLGRKADAAFSSETALRNDPNDPFAHVADGWRRLHLSDAKGACEAFRTALRLEPTSAAARAGMIESLKARYWVYRQYSRIQFWLGRQNSQFQWFFVIGLFVMMRILSTVGKANPEWKVVTTPLLVAFVCFGLMTWMGSGLFNLLLLFHPLGRQAMNREEKREGFWLAGFLLLGLSGLAASEVGPLLPRSPPSEPIWKQFLPVALIFIGLNVILASLTSVFAVAGWYRVARGWPRRVTAIALALPWVVWGVAVYTIVDFLGGQTEPELRAGLQTIRQVSDVALYLVLGTAIGLNILMASRPNRD